MLERVWILTAVVFLLVCSTPAGARVHVQKTRDGMVLRVGREKASFDAIRRAGEVGVKLGAYTARAGEDGKIRATRSWTFGKTPAKHTQTFDATGRLLARSVSTGSLKLRHTATDRGWSESSGRYTWKTWMTHDRPLVLHIWGQHERGPTATHRQAIGPRRHYVKNVHRDGRVEVEHKALPTLPTLSGR